MQLIVNAERYNDPSPLNLMGGEGELYALNTENVAKVYHEEIRSDERKRKVLALCNSFQNDAAKGGATSVAFPQFPAYELVVSLDTLVGFSMRWFKNCPAIVALGYDLSKNAFNEDKGVCFDKNSALGFVYNAFEAVDQLHQARIVLGDVNPANILYNPATRRPVIIDVDSAQIGSFACPATHELYNDPRLQQRGKSLGGGLTFDAGTDTFALAVVCFEFLVGVRPYQLYVTPTNPRGEVENKLKGISSIKCFEVGRHCLSGLGVTYLDCPENQAVESRLAQLKTEDRRLYDFFVGIFVHDERENLLFSLPLMDPRHPGNRFLVESGFKKVVDDEAKKRQQYAAVQTRQGVVQRPTALPDSGFRKVIDSLGMKTKASTATKKPVASRKPPPRVDPVGFNLFLQHFGLGV
jgi:serine/threonine protein kinase